MSRLKLKSNFQWAQVIGDFFYAFHCCIIDWPREIGFLFKHVASGIALILSAAICQAAPAQDTPEIKVDQEHLQMQSPGSKQLVYQIHQCNGFVLDTGGYIFKERAEHAGHRKVIQVIEGRNQLLCLPLTDGQSRYLVRANRSFTTGQKLVVGIGYQVDCSSTIKFYPDWIGLVEVR